MTNQEEHLNQLAIEYENYLKNHKDNRMLDLSELDITSQQVDWIITKAIETGYVRTDNCFNCRNCKHFTKGVMDWDDICNMNWDCAFYGDKPIRWELIR